MKEIMERINFWNAMLEKLEKHIDSSTSIDDKRKHRKDKAYYQGCVDAAKYILENSQKA